MWSALLFFILTTASIAVCEEEKGSNNSSNATPEKELSARLSFGSRNQIVLLVLSVALIPSLQSTSTSSPLWDLKRLFSSFRKTSHLRNRVRFAIIWLKTTPSLTMWIYPAVLRSLFLNGDEDLISFLSSKNSLELKVMSLLSLQE